VAIKITCSCGKRLAIEPQFVGKKIACPQCQKRFVLTKEKLAALIQARKEKEPAAPAPGQGSADPSAAGQVGSNSARPKAETVVDLTLLPANLDDEFDSAPSGGAGLVDETGRRAATRTAQGESPEPLAMDGDGDLSGTVRLMDDVERKADGGRVPNLSLTGKNLVTGKVKVVGDARRHAEDDAPILLAGDLLSAMATDAAEAPSTGAPAPSVVVIDNAVDLQYAAGERPRVAARAPRPGDEIQVPKRSFWEDLALSFVYPVWSVNNILNLCIIAFFVAVSAFLGFAGSAMGIISLAGKLIIYGWLAAVYMSVVTDSAAGSEDMPGIKMEQGIFEDIIRPMVRYLGSFAMAVFPAFVVAVAIDIGAPLHPLAILGVFVIGVFFWPLMMLLFSTGVIQEAVRVDRMIATVARTILPYLILWVMLLVGLAVIILSSALAAALLDFSGVPKKYFFLTGGGFAMDLGVRLIELYLWLVTMRVIGLYYHHYKQKFAFVLE